MKKTLKFFYSMFMLAALTTVFYSCSSDDGDDAPEDSKPVSVVISYSYENHVEFYKYFETEITYLDKSGKEQKVVLNSNKTSWKYEEKVNYASAPKNYSCIILVKKTGVEPETETCKANGLGSYEFSVNSIHNDGETYYLGPNFSHKVNANNMNIAKALESVPAEGKVLYDYSYTHNK